MARVASASGEPQASAGERRRERVGDPHARVDPSTDRILDERVEGGRALEHAPMLLHDQFNIQRYPARVASTKSGASCCGPPHGVTFAWYVAGAMRSK